MVITVADIRGMASQEKSLEMTRPFQSCLIISSFMILIQVISAVEKLYAVDALYWTADGPELLALGNANVLELCKNA